MKCKNCGQDIGNNKFCTSCGASAESFSSSPTNQKLSQIGNTNFKNDYKKPKSTIVIWVVIALVIIISVISDSLSGSSATEDSSVKQDSSQVLTRTTFSQSEVARNVVNILCSKGNESSGGSGTILYSNGLILTNNHIIPQDNKGNFLVDNCIVTLPNPESGKIDEIYNGMPISIPVLSKEYDLAFVSIESPYTDEDGVVYGQYNKKFSGQLDAGCENDSPVLGEKIKVFGYPAISGGGYYLTITEGIVSSLPDDGTIVTSAKVSHGNSGGLAVDENGCMLGVPSMFDGDEAESLGIIISNNIIGEFLEKLGILIDEINKQ